MGAFDKFVQGRGQIPSSPSSGSFDQFAKSNLGIDFSASTKAQEAAQKQARIQKQIDYGMSLMANRGLSQRVSNLVYKQPTPSKLSQTFETIKALGKNVIQSPLQDINTLKLGSAADIALRKYTAAKLTNNKVAQENALKEYNQFKTNLQKTGGIGGVGLTGGYTPIELGKPLAPGRLAKTIAARGAEYGSYAVGGAGVKPVTTAFKAGIRPGLAAGGKFLATEAASGALGFGGYQAAQPGATAKEITQAALKGAAVGAAGAAAFGAAGLGLKATGKGIEKGLAKVSAGAEKIPAVAAAKNKLEALFNNQAAVQRALGKELDTSGVTAYKGISKADVADQLRANVVRSEGQARAIFEPAVKQIKLTKQNYANVSKELGAYQAAFNKLKTGQEATLPKLSAQAQTVYKQLNDATKPVVEAAHKGQLIDDATYQTWLKDKNYIRLQQNISEKLDNAFGKPAGFQIKSNILQQKLKGKVTEAVDPIAAYIDWTRAVVRDINRAKYSDYVLSNLAKTGKAIELPTALTKSQIEKQLERPDVVGTFQKGIKQLYQVDKNVAKSLKNTNPFQIGPALQWLYAPGRALKTTATGVNPAFILPNIVVDQQTSAILGKNATALLNPKTAFLAVKDVSLGNLGVKATTKKGRQLIRPQFAEYLKNNSNMTSFDLARNVEKAVNEAFQLTTGKARTKGAAISRAGRKLEDLASSSEQATRYENWIIAYSKARKQGLPEAAAKFRADIAARKNSVDFSTVGEATAFLRFIDPYANANLQGIRSLGKALQERPVGTSLKIATTLVMPTMGLTYWNYSDPKRAKVYQSIPDYEKRTHFIFVRENGEGYIKIKMPPGMSNFTKPFRNMVEAEYVGDRQGFMETAKNLLVDPFSPLGQTKIEAFGKIIPQPIKPLIESSFNINFFTGQPLVSKQYQDLPAREQVYDNTSQIYRDIGKVFNTSPENIKNIVRGYFPGAGEQQFENVDWLRKNLLGQDIVAGKRTTGEQIVGRLYKAAPEGEKAVANRFYPDYYNLRAEKKSTDRKINEAIKSNDYTKARSLADTMNQQISNYERTFKTTYGKYHTDSQLLKTLNELKISTSDKSFKSRKKRIEKGQ